MGQIQSICYKRSSSLSAVSGRISKNPPRIQRGRRARSNFMQSVSRASNQTTEEITNQVETVHPVRLADPRNLVGKLIQVYWDCTCAWFDCDVIEYCEEGSETGKYLVQYSDGIKEWRLLHEYRLVTDGQADEVNVDSSE